VKRVFVDTGAWYALIDAADPDHDAVTAVFRHYRHRLVTSNYVFDETLTLARYRLGWQVAHRIGEQLWDSRLARIERVSPKDEQAAWSIFSGYSDKSFSFTDCTSFALVQRLNLPLCLAIDSDFRSFGLHCIPEAA
jgi:predicted nucleic acid-binding protein